MNKLFNIDHKCYNIIMKNIFGYSYYENVLLYATYPYGLEIHKVDLYSLSEIKDVYKPIFISDNCKYGYGHEILHDNVRLLYIHDDFESYFIDNHKVTPKIEPSKMYGSKYTKMLDIMNYNTMMCIVSYIETLGYEITITKYECVIYKGDRKITGYYSVDKLYAIFRALSVLIEHENIIYDKNSSASLPNI